MKVDGLTLSYLEKARIRFKALGFYKENHAYSDVVREAREMVELLLKAVLRAIGFQNACARKENLVFAVQKILYPLKNTALKMQKWPLKMRSLF
ncbi:hypothetical protein [Thermoanaerobacterium sp. DL9XJH110]|uniref:hypothetical protein n=1 Tax=Thermoanaerobacterium sp. DL9XJH110 TaxID=3386643 RepID=UPI003BB75534